MLGIGCRRGTPGDVIETAVRETLEEHHLDIRGVSGAASIDLKKDEAGLLETEQRYRKHGGKSSLLYTLKT